MKKILILLTILVASYQVKAQDEKFKALYMYNITNFIEWPSYGTQFVICIFGESPVATVFKTDFGTKSINGRPIVIKVIQKADELTGCHLLYIPKNQPESVYTEVSSKLTGKPTLVIGDRAGAIAKGASINFIMEGKLSIEISRRSIESHNLKVNSQLIELGIEVN